MKIVNKLRKGQVTILGKAIPVFALVALMGMGTALAAGYLLLTSTSTVTITESITLYYWNGASWTTFGTLPQTVPLGPLSLYPGDSRVDYFAAKNNATNPIIITMDLRNAATVSGFSASLVCDGTTGSGSGVYFVQDTTPGIWHVYIPGGSVTKSIGINNVVDINAAPVSGATFNSYTYRGTITVAQFNAMAYTTCL
jgi:hypothetical protein